MSWKILSQCISVEIQLSAVAVWCPRSYVILMYGYACVHNYPLSGPSSTITLRPLSHLSWDLVSSLLRPQNIMTPCCSPNNYTPSTSRDKTHSCNNLKTKTFAVTSFIQNDVPILCVCSIIFSSAKTLLKIFKEGEHLTPRQEGCLQPQNLKHYKLLLELP